MKLYDEDFTVLYNRLREEQPYLTEDQIEEIIRGFAEDMVERGLL